MFLWKKFVPFKVHQWAHDPAVDAAVDAVVAAVDAAVDDAFITYAQRLLKTQGSSGICCKPK